VVERRDRSHPTGEFDRRVQTLSGPSAGLQKTGVRALALILLLWLIIGAIAAGQRHYVSGGNTNCAKVGTITATILAGPLTTWG
jgi:hypothetical protein